MDQEFGIVLEEKNFFFSFSMVKLQETEEKQKEGRREEGNIQAKYSILILKYNTGAVDLWGYDHHLCLPPFCFPTIVHLPFFK